MRELARWFVWFAQVPRFVRIQWFASWVPAGTRWVPAGASWVPVGYQLVPAGYQLVPAGTSWSQLVPADASWYQPSWQTIVSGRILVSGYPGEAWYPGKPTGANSLIGLGARRPFYPGIRALAGNPGDAIYRFRGTSGHPGRGGWLGI